MALAAAPARRGAGGRILRAMPEPPPALILHPGTVFAERYRIEDLLGQGGMGTVYRARDLSLGEPVALKIRSTISARPRGCST